MTLLPIRLVLLLLTFLIELCRGASISGCKADERNALLNLKKNLEDKHSRLASWKDENCCNWDGVSCNNVTSHVVRLDLRNPYPCYEIEFLDTSDDLFIQCNEWSLRGELNPSLLGLKQLNYLDLSINHFDGSIPKFLGSLHNLRYLNLSLAGFRGLIPHHLGNLSRLKYLDLDNFDRYDYGYGNIDDSRWISRLTSLKLLTMTNIKFENFQNWIEALNELPNIAEIRLSSCDINAFPLSLPYVNFTNLSYLDLSSNFIDLEMIPLWLFNIKSLTHIDLSENDFRSIPDALKNLTSLEYIDFSYNQFSGALPQVLKSLRKVRTLDLSGNVDINGSLPNWLGELHMLEYLDLSFNNINGSLPNSLGRLVALQQLILSRNNLNGTVPESIGQLSNLVNLQLQHNFFGGVISEVHFASLAKLKELDLGSNNLILNVSRDWIPPFKLDIIGMSSCKIGPEFPRWLQTQVNLLYLNFSSSHIVDFLPHWFWNVFVTHDTCIWLDLSNNGITGSLPNLSKLCFQNFNLSSNFFSGPLPPTLNISGDVMDISNNSFSGPINPIIINKDQWIQMMLSRNKFSGEIPSWICLADVDYLDFSWNLLTGEIPNCWGAYNGIHSIDFSRNYLSGNIPHTLGNLISLTSLHLDNNILSGNIPSTLGNCIYLTTLHLDNNILSGNIPSTLGNCIYLTTLDLSFNNLKGNVVPTNFWKLNLLQILDLSCNKLSGQIPIELVNLKGLEYLNLSGNHLVGSIPDAIGFMLSLESLDMSRNGLSGNIPLSMSIITTLDFLNLSYNNLSGRIPSRNQFQSLTNESYIGNPQLCGFPLTQPCDSNKTINVEVSVTESDYWYVSIALGFVVGFGIVWGTLFLKKKRKDAYFRYVDYVYDAIFKRKIGNEIASG